MKSSNRRKRHIRKTSEKDLQKLVIDYVRSIGGVAIKFYAGGLKFGDRFIPQNKAGVSDILACLPPDGKFMAIETKVKGNKPTVLQSCFLSNVRDSGGLGMVAYSLDEVMEAIKKEQVKQNEQTG